MPSRVRDGYVALDSHSQKDQNSYDLETLLNTNASAAVVIGVALLLLGRSRPLSFPFTNQLQYRLMVLLSANGRVLAKKTRLERTLGSDHLWWHLLLQILCRLPLLLLQSLLLSLHLNGILIKCLLNGNLVCQVHLIQWAPGPLLRITFIRHQGCHIDCLFNRL